MKVNSISKEGLIHLLEKVFHVSNQSKPNKDTKSVTKGST